MTSDFNVDDLANDPEFVDGLHNGFSSALEHDKDRDEAASDHNASAESDELNFQIFTRDDYMSVTLVGKKTGKEYTFGFYSLQADSVGVSAIRAGLDGLVVDGEITDGNKNEIMESVLNVLLDVDSINKPLDTRDGE